VNGDERRLVMSCETEKLVIETSLSRRFTRIHTDKISDL
jgi:hypothetical protein